MVLNNDIYADTESKHTDELYTIGTRGKRNPDIFGVSYH